MREPPLLKLPRSVQLAWWLAHPNSLFEFAHQRLGATFAMTLPDGYAVFVGDPEEVRRIFSGDPEVFLGGAARKLIRPLVGTFSLLTLDGPEYRRQRKLLMPPLHGDRMRAYTEAMRNITECAIAGWPRGRPFGLRPQLQQITLRVILRVVFGAEAGRLRRLATLITAYLRNYLSPLIALPRLAGLRVGRLFRDRSAELKAQVDEEIFELIRSRRRATVRGNDVASMLVEARDEAGAPMTDQEIRDELITLLLAGHETTATTLAWFFEVILARGHETQCQTVRSEIRQAIAGTQLQSDHLADMHYLDATIREVLRLHPITPNVARKLSRDFEVAGYRVRAGALVAPCNHMIHRDPQLYPQPTKFRPERFYRTKPDPCHWFPFGGGLRRCTGMAFSLHEAKVVAATILSQTELRLASRIPARTVRRSITLAPTGVTRVVRS